MGLLNRLVASSLRFMPRFLAGGVARRYVAGETLEQALDTAARLNGQGMMATIALLGEEVSERQRAEAAVEEHIRLVDEIAARGVEANVSVKLTLLGLRIDEALCRENLGRVAAAAKVHGSFVRIDMEDHTTTDATLRIYRALQPAYGNLGVVFQAYLKRTLADIAELPEDGANVRLCKGIYVEPEEVAWKGYEAVRLNFILALEKLLSRGIYVGIATHDEYLVCAAAGLVEKYSLQPQEYEFQMLLGVEPRLRQSLVDAGHRLRVYIPYGEDWYAYSLRRLRENPEIVGHVMRGVLRGRTRRE